MTSGHRQFRGGKLILNCKHEYSAVFCSTMHQCIAFNFIKIFLAHSFAYCGKKYVGYTDPVFCHYPVIYLILYRYFFIHLRGSYGINIEEYKGTDLEIHVVTTSRHYNDNNFPSRSGTDSRFWISDNTMQKQHDSSGNQV